METIGGSGVFQNKLRLEINDFKLTAIDCLDNYVVIGDEKGNIASYVIGQNGNLTLEYEHFIAKGKIEQIKCVAHLNMAYVVLGGHLYGYSVPRLDQKFKFEHKDAGTVHMIALNGHQNSLNQIIVATKKKKIKCYEYNPEIAKLLEMKIEEMKLLDVVDSIEWYGNWFCAAVKKKVFFVNINTGVTVNSDLESSHVRQAYGCWLVLFGNLGIFMENNAPKQVNPLNFSTKPFVNFNVYKNYVISMHDSLIGIFDSNESAQVQEIHYDQGSVGRFLAVSQKRLFYVISTFSDKKDTSSFQVWEMVELAYEMQINKLLNEGKVDEALNILNNNISSSNEEKPKKIEQFFIDSSWACLKKGDFDKAFQYAKLTAFNPFEYIYLFRNELKIKILHEESKSITNLPTIETYAKTEEDTKDSLKMLYNLLNDKRNYILSYFEIPKDNLKKMSYINSDLSLINLTSSKTELPVYAVLEILNSVMIKLLVRRKENHQKIWHLVDYEYFNCEWEDLESFLINENNDISRIGYAYLCERKSKYEEALKIWQDYGSKDNSNAVLSREATDRTRAILKKSQEKSLFHDYIQWIIIKYPIQAFELFMNTDIVPPEYFFSTIIGAVEKSSPNLNLKEKFLEYYIENGCQNERYHTILAENYIEKVFKIKKPDTPYDPSMIEGNLKFNLDKLDKLLQTSTHYNDHHILEKIQNSWMIEQKIFLFSKLGLHSEALVMLVSNGIEQGDFEKAEKYCADMIQTRPELFADFFRILSENYNSNFNASKSVKSESDRKNYENKAMVFQKEMLSVLKKHGDQNTLDPFVVLEELPNDWIICDQSLYEYLTKIMKNYIHMNNKYKVAKSLSEVALIYKEKDILDLKDKSVTISNETQCDLCRKKIGNSTFCAYPNMKIYHQKCTTNLTICPVTRTDFTKKKVI